MAAEYRAQVRVQQADLPAVSAKDKPPSPVRSRTLSPAKVSEPFSAHWFSASLPEESPCLLTGIAFVGGNIAVCDNENKTVKRFSTEGKFLEELFLHDPCGVCRLPNSMDIAVTEPDIKQITVCTLEKALVVTFELKTSRKYESISAFQDKYVVGCCEVGHSSVDFLDSNGTILRNIRGVSDDQLLFRNPAAITCLTSGDVLISDPGSCILICVSQNHKVKFKLDLGGRPSGICTDSQGSIYMAQYDSNLVMRLSTNGKTEGVVIDEKFELTSPLAMTVENNLLALTEETPSDRILVLKLQDTAHDTEQDQSLINLRMNSTL